MDTSHLYKRLREFISSASRPLIVILGPSASGKTDFSLDVAAEISGAEVINADSRQLYRHLDIGTAKIRPDEMRGIPHHLIDVLDPKEEVTSAWYRDQALRTIDDSLNRKKTPVLVGGSMLYISAVIDGLAFPVGSDTVLRERLEAEYDQDGGVTLHGRLTGIDSEAAAGIPQQNKPYVIRALELYELSGKKPSDLRHQSDCPYDLFVIGIERSRDELVRRINERTKKLLNDGWMEEVSALIAKGYGPCDPGMKSHGYREIMEYLNSGRNDLDVLAEDISAKTRQYAKRQMTWWKGDPRIQWMSS